MSLTACMTVHVDAGNQPITVIRHAGLLRIEAPLVDRAFVGELRGVGLLATPAGITLGYTRERWAVMGPECRAVLWVDEGITLDESLRDQLEHVAGLCLLAPSSASISQQPKEQR